VQSKELENVYQHTSN